MEYYSLFFEKNTLENNMKNALICIDGVVGAGKTTLGEIVCREFGINFFKEPVDNNPLLERFYEDQKRFSFPMQIYFLNKRFKMLKEAKNLPHASLLDRSIYGDVIFARLLFLQGKMMQEEFELYEELLHNMLEHTQKPRLMVYLRVNTDNAVKRIRERGRSFEQEVPLQYWELLNEEYEKYFKHYQFSDLLVIDVNEVDFRQKGAAQNDILQQIQTRLYDTHNKAAESFSSAKKVDIF
jgi:deoxyadenosine/deoxycytidine kinase